MSASHALRDSASSLIQRQSSPVRPLLRRRAAAFALAIAFVAHAQNTSQPSYYEFGKVVALGRDTVDIQSFDPQRQRLVQHSFTLSRESRADIVHVGDDVEVVFTPTSAGWSLRRLLLLPAGVPLAGPPPPQPPPETNATTVRTPQPAVPQVTHAQLPTAPAPKPSRRTTHPKPAPATTVAAATPPIKPVPANLSASSAGKAVPPVVPVALGSPAEAAARVAAAKTRNVAIETPSEECNRSSADWPTLPVRLGVLDFRYPTEREEAHDIGTTGGGSGTAVADLVFARLDQQSQADPNPQFALSRGDRRRLDRSDFAGAARIGRQLGVDAVLAGTFVPVPNPSAPDDPYAAKSYELREGIVDTCTGQLLLQTSSVACPGALEPGLTAGTDHAACTRLAASAAETADPKAHTPAFKPLLDDLLFPLEHDGKSTNQMGSAGVVTSFDGGQVSILLPRNVQVHPGDQLALHATRLAKNPTTYTLHYLQSEEIGRVSVQSVSGGIARGAYTGDFTPRPGDTADLISN